MKNCDNCERRFKDGRLKGCHVFTEKPDNCWAWTDDPDWLEKVNEAVNNYEFNHAEL